MRWGPFSSELLVCVVFDFTMNDLLRHQLVVLEYGLLVGLRDAALM